MLNLLVQDAALTTQMKQLNEQRLAGNLSVPKFISLLQSQQLPAARDLYAEAQKMSWDALSYAASNLSNILGYVVKSYRLSDRLRRSVLVHLSDNYQGGLSARQRWQGERENWPRQTAAVHHQ